MQIFAKAKLTDSMGVESFTEPLTCHDDTNTSLKVAVRTTLPLESSCVSTSELKCLPADTAPKSAGLHWSKFFCTTRSLKFTLPAPAPPLELPIVVGLLAPHAHDITENIFVPVVVWQPSEPMFTTIEDAGAGGLMCASFAFWELPCATANVVAMHSSAAKQSFFIRSPETQRRFLVTVTRDWFVSVVEAPRTANAWFALRQ